MQSRARAPSTRNEDTIRLLKEALFENGRDKNVTTSIAPALLQYNRNELTLSIEFSTQLKTDELEWAFELCKENMEDTYDKSGYGEKLSSNLPGIKTTPFLQGGTMMTRLES